MSAVGPAVTHTQQCWGNLQLLPAESGPVGKQKQNLCSFLESMNIDLITWAALLQSDSSLLVRVPEALVVLPNAVTEHKTQPDTTPVS